MGESNLIGQQIQGYNIVKKLGSGGFGTVYLGEKEDLGKKYQTAIKHISIPDSDGYETVLQDYGYDKTATLAHFEKLVEGITSEINTLLDLSKKDNRYIVAYYDHDIQKSLDPLHFDIFLRMEYLTPLNTHIRQKGITMGEVIKIGLNMCDALILCHNNGIMHRDIKEANIFVNENNNFKLGDFGVAKVAFESTQAGSIKGTASYMAPEIYLHQSYDTSVDVYSLGIVLYKLLNNQRLPFMPDAPAQFTADDKNNAETRRLKGDVPPLPANAKNRLGEIVVKACLGKESRYQKAEEFKKDLSAFLSTLTLVDYDQIVVAQSSDGSVTAYEQNSVNSYTQTQGATMTMGAQNGAMNIPPANINPYADKPKKKKTLMIASILSLLLIAISVAGFIFISKIKDPVNQFQAAVEKNDFMKASQLYRDELKFGESKKLAEAETYIVNHAVEVKSKYTKSEITYEDTLNQLQEMGKLGIVNATELQPIITEVNEIRTSRAAFDSAQKKMEENDFKSAINELHKVIQTDSNYENAQTQMVAAIIGYKDQIMDSLQDIESNKRYSEAISTLKAALIVVPEDADFLAQIADYEKKINDDINLIADGIIRDAKTLIATNADYSTALNDLRSAAKNYPNNDALKGSILEIEGEYLNKILSEAETLAVSKKYDEAITMLSSALVLLPANNSVNSAISEYKSKLPVLLSKLTYFTGEALDFSSSGMDNLQKQQKNVYWGKAKYNSFDNVYKLNGKYTKITGTFFQPFDYRSDNQVMCLRIYGNDLVIYDAEMTAGIEPINFSIDLTGVQTLRINMWRKPNSYYNFAYGSLANVFLHQ